MIQFRAGILALVIWTMLGSPALRAQTGGDPPLPACEPADIDHVVGRRADDAVESGLFGNGGDALVRKDPEGSRRFAMLLDFYEGRTTLPAMLPVLGGADLPVRAKVGLALDRLARLDRLRADRYRAWLAEFTAQACFASRIQLKDIDDSQHVQLPDGEGWSVEQVAIHTEPILPEYPRYLINKDIWDLMDQDNRAGLILHELAYREAVSHGVQSSRHVRAVVMSIASGMIDRWTLKDYVTRIQSIGYGSFSYGGVWLSLAEEVGFDQDSTSVILYGTVAPGTKLDLPWGSLALRCQVGFNVEGRLMHSFRLAQTDRKPRLRIGDRDLFLWDSGDNTVACGDLPQFPLFEGCGGDYDVFFEFPEDPGRGTTHLRTSDTEPVESEAWEYLIGHAYSFMDGEIDAALALGGGTDDWIIVNGMRCPVAEGRVVYRDFPIPELIQLGTCDIPLAASIARIKGETTLEPVTFGVRAVEIELAAPQTLIVHPSTRNEARFTGRVRLWPGGTVREARLAEAAVLKAADGSVKHGVTGEGVDFDELGYVIK